MLPLLKEWLHDRTFHGRMLKLALPMALASVLSSSLQIVDTLMIAMLGDVSVAAVGMANRLTYILSFFTAGLASGASIFGAQFWGDRSMDGLKRTMGLSVLLVVPITAIFALIAMLAPQWVMRIFSQEPDVVAQGCTYLRWLGPAYLFQGISALLAAMLKATEKPRIPMAASAVGIVSNVILNYILIFGAFGLPAMGVRGAAIATLIAAGVECVYLMAASQARGTVSVRPGSLLMPSRAFAGKYLKITIPVLINDVGWALGIVAMTWVYSTMGTAAAAAASVYETIKAFVVVFCSSLGTAGGILLGIELGAGHREEAERMSQKILLSAFAVSLVVSPVMLVLIRPLMGLYGQMSADALEKLSGMLTILAVLFVVKAFDFNLINGILRAGGDTKAAAAIDVGCLWLIAVPLVYFTGCVLKWDIVHAFAFTFFEESIVVWLAWRRWKQGKWLQKL